MKVLVIGSGGREHALCKKIKKSKRVTEVYCAPGNAGISEDATLVPIQETDFSNLIQFAKAEQIELTIVGPEVPLAAGIVDEFKAAGLKIFGPNKHAAMIESSKSFAKDLMEKYQIPTANHQTFTSYEEAKAYIDNQGAPIVIKADGLAAGKGVVVAMTLEEADQALKEMLVEAKFGDSSTSVVVEEFLEGEEFSLMAFVYNEKVYPMVIAQDHKRAYDGDQGPNTGGMGAYSPVPQIPQEQVDKAVNEILIPTANAMIKENRPFQGILYAGLIQTKQGPKVIEFNARFGDPETQVVLERLDSDLVEVILNIMDGKTPNIKWSNEAVVGVVLAAKGYPGLYEKGKRLPDLTNTDSNIVVFHAGTSRSPENGSYLSNGGRILLTTAKAATIKQAIDKVYDAMRPLKDEPDFYFRNDIAHKSI